MAVCYLKSQCLCTKCANLGVSSHEDLRVLELSDLCNPCVRRLRTSYVGVVSAKFDQPLIDMVRVSRGQKPVAMEESHA
jgi:hypothetical protein